MAKKAKSKDQGEEFVSNTDESLFLDGLLCHEPSALLKEESEAQWVKLQGATPLEFLVMVYKNPLNEIRDRINAAKSILDFVHKKLPQKIEVEGNMRDTRKITAENLSKLTDEELSVFTKLLEKLGG